MEMSTWNSQSWWEPYNTGGNTPLKFPNDTTDKLTKFIPIETKKKFSVQLELFPEMQLRKIPHKKFKDKTNLT